MPIRVECPICNNVHEIVDDNLGKNLVCKHCNNKVSISSAGPSAVEPVAVIATVPIPLPPEPTHDLPTAAIDQAQNLSISPTPSEPKVVEWSDVEDPDPDSEESDTEIEKPIRSTNRRDQYVQKKRRRSKRRLYSLIALTLLLLIAA